MVIRKYQMGGSAPEQAAPEQEAAVEQQAANPEEQLQEMAGQLAQSLLEQIQDPNAVMAILQMAMEMIQQSAGAAPEAAQEPVFKKGGKLCKGGKAAKKKC